MADAPRSSMKEHSGCLAPGTVRGVFALLAVASLITSRGPLSAPGQDPDGGKVVRCPECGRKVRLARDGWGTCPKCGAFDGGSAEKA